MKGYDGLIWPGNYPDSELRAVVQGDKRGLQPNIAQLQPFVCDLSVARSLSELQIEGDVLYVDRTSTGIIKFRAATSWQRSYPLGANDGLKDYPYSRPLIEWDAQGAGVFAILWFGYGVNIVPSIGSISSISTIGTVTTITNPVDARPYGYTYGAAYASNVALTAATPVQVVAPASNTNGITVWAAGATHSPASSLSHVVLIAKASAPSTIIDGDVYYHNSVGGSNQFAGGDTNVFPVRVAAGKGLYWITDQNEASGFRRVLYTVH